MLDEQVDSRREQSFVSGGGFKKKKVKKISSGLREAEEREEKHKLSEKNTRKGILGRSVSPREEGGK